MASMTPLSDDRALWLSQCVLPHEPALRTWLRHRCVAGLDVDDVIQETYARLAAKNSVAEVRDPKTYMFQTAQSVILTFLRRSRIVSIRSAADIEDLAAVPEICPQRVLEGVEELQKLGEVIASLPDKCRQVFMLRRVEGLSQRDVARQLGVSEGTVEKHMARGIRLLMDVFGRGGRAAAAAPRTIDATLVRHGKPTVRPRNR